jgi:hypothetical protein
MKTTVFQIGNTDNKLRQNEWADFVGTVKTIIAEHAATIYFFGGTENWAAMQRVCWVFDCEEPRLGELKVQLAEARKKFRQDSLAFTNGDTEFV